MRVPVTLANGLTIVRILLIPVFMAFLLGLSAIPYREDIAVAIFVVAALTDTLDGYFARSRNAVTVLGKLLDPLADKLLISAALVSLVELGRVPAWIAMVIISREFAVSGLRLVAAAEHVVIAASPLGKVKTVSQVIAVVALILPQYGDFLGRPVSWYLLYLAALLTVWSGIDYFRKARNWIKEPAPESSVRESTREHPGKLNASAAGINSGSRHPGGPHQPSAGHESLPMREFK